MGPNTYSEGIWKTRVIWDLCMFASFVHDLAITIGYGH